MTPLTSFNIDSDYSGLSNSLKPLKSIPEPKRVSLYAAYLSPWNRQFQLLSDQHGSWSLAIQEILHQLLERLLSPISHQLGPPLSSIHLRSRRHRLVRERSRHRTQSARVYGL